MIIKEKEEGSFSLIPSSKENKSIIGKVVSDTFFPETVSRNGNYYSNSVWQEAISTESFKSRIANRTMLGTIGHDDDIDDRFLRDGKISHIMTNAYIDPERNVGVCEFDLLNTETGRLVKTLLEAGMKLKVSTQMNCDTVECKYNGNIKEHIGKTFQVPKPGTIDFFRVDFVIDPGYLETNPKLVESANRYFKSIAKNTNLNEILKKPNVAKPNVAKPNVAKPKKESFGERQQKFTILVKRLTRKLNDLKLEQEREDFINDLIEKEGEQFANLIVLNTNLIKEQELLLLEMQTQKEKLFELNELIRQKCDELEELESAKVVEKETSFFAILSRFNIENEDELLDYLNVAQNQYNSLLLKTAKATGFEIKEIETLLNNGISIENIVKKIIDKVR